MENRDGHDTSTKYFVGKEVEHTPAHGLNTLFVVGVQPAQEILVKAFNNVCPHIYLGANQSFNPQSDLEMTQWISMALELLGSGNWVTLDLDIAHAEKVAFSGITQYNNLIVIISAKIPYINKFNYHTVVKIDDKGFKASNPGVWCHSLHDLQSRKQFTNWSLYTNDEVLKD